GGNAYSRPRQSLTDMVYFYGQREQPESVDCLRQHGAQDTATHNYVAAYKHQHETLLLRFCLWHDLQGHETQIRREVNTAAVARRDESVRRHRLKKVRLRQKAPGRGVPPPDLLFVKAGSQRQHS